MPEPIPGEWLSAVTLAIEAAPPESSSAHLARLALEVAVPLIRESLATEREFGVRYTIVLTHEYASPDECTARSDVAEFRDERPDFRPVLIARVPARPAGPWKEVPDA